MNTEQILQKLGERGFTLEVVKSTENGSTSIRAKMTHGADETLGRRFILLDSGGTFPTGWNMSDAGDRATVFLHMTLDLLEWSGLRIVETLE